MKIAAITITYNDSYKLKEWVNYYNEYKDDIYLHLIIDNCSEPNYINEVEKSFPNSTIIKRNVNGGTTSAYNDGIKYALADGNVEVIMLIANDIRLELGGGQKLFDFLNSNTSYGMVAPVLLVKDSLIIEVLGSSISPFLYMIPQNYGKNVNNVLFYKQETDSVMGGMNIAKREFYEKVGIQDENLFMYSDEVDMGLRAKKAGYLLAVTNEVKCWHQHINPDGRNIRKPYSAFLIGRNKVYLAYKHFGNAKALFVFFFQLFTFLKSIFNSLNSYSKFQFQLYFLLGSICGILGIKKNFEFIKNNK